MKKILFAVVLAAGLSQVGPTAAVETTNPPGPLCGPTTPGTCPADQYSSIVKAINECGFAKTCSPIGTFAVYPSLECEYRYGEIVCDAWPQTWPGTSNPITYQWSAIGSISLPSGYGNHSPSVSFNCLHVRGGTVLLRMQAPGGTNWVQMSVGLPCRNLITQ
jgi:hypothetical protein